MSSSFVSARARRLSRVVLSAAVALVVAVPVSSASAAARPLTLLIDASVNTPFGSYPGHYSGAKAAARAINKAKKLNVKIVTCNSKATTAGAQACVKQAIDEKVVGVIGSDPFLESGFGITELKSAGIPFSLFASNAEIFTGAHSNSFPVNGSAFAPFASLGTLAKKAGGTKLGIVCTEIPGFDVVCENIKRTAAKNGLKVVAETSVALTSTTFSTQAQKLKAGGADVVAIATPGTFATSVVQAAKSIGFSPTWVTARASFPDPKAFASLTKVTGDKLWVNSSLPPIESVKSYPGLKQYASQNKGVKLVNQDEGSITTWATVYGYAKVAESIKGPITAAKMIAALNKAKNVKVGNGLVAWSPGKKGKAPYTKLPSDLIYYGQVKKGKYVPNPKKPIHGFAGATLK